MIVLKNDFYGTSKRIRKKDGDLVSTDLVRRWRNSLCPSRTYPGCGGCEDAACQRGEGRRVEVVPAGFIGGYTFFEVQEDLPGRMREQFSLLDNSETEKGHLKSVLKVDEVFVGEPALLVFDVYDRCWDVVGEIRRFGVVSDARQGRVIVSLGKGHGGMSAAVVADDERRLVKNPVLKKLRFGEEVLEELEEDGFFDADSVRKLLRERLFMYCFPETKVPDNVDYPFVWSWYRE